MKKTLLFLSAFFIFALSFQYALANDFNGLKVGSRSEVVKDLQEALKGDSSIYPEGLTTGYFGSMTKKAIQRVQARCGLPQNGIVDDSVTRCIFPSDYMVVVSSPNGGEIWDRNQTQTIKWDVIQSDRMISNDSTKIMPPIWSKVSIDLFRRVYPSGCANSSGEYICDVEPRSVFVKHLGMGNLLSGSYSWKITSDIADGSDYVVRVTVGQATIQMYRYEIGKELIRPDIWPLPQGNWDESNNPFTIEGKIVPPPSAELKQLLEILQQISVQMTRAIQLLNQIISNQ